MTEVLSPHGEVVVYKKGGALGDSGDIKFVNFEDVIKSEVIILAVGLSSMSEVCKDLAGRVSPHTIVVDVCSVKMKPLEIMNEYLKDKCQIMATHPLMGPHTTKADDLTGKNIVICSPGLKNQDKINDFLSATLGLNIIEMTAEQHDKEMAWIHGLTFFVGRGIMNLDPPRSDLTTGYYQKLLDLVELESTHSIELFNTIQKGNPFAADIRESLLKQLQKIDSEIKNG